MCHIWPLCSQMDYCAVVFVGCPAECEVCVSSDTCTRCRPGLYQLSGRCHHVCPEDYEPNDKLMECTPQGESRFCVSGWTHLRCHFMSTEKHFLILTSSSPFLPLSVHCEVGEWNEWSPCSRSGRTCGFKRGQETRTRQVLQYPSPFGNPCPEISEIKECLLKRRKCPGKENSMSESAVRFSWHHCCLFLSPSPSRLSLTS